MTKGSGGHGSGGSGGKSGGGGQSHQGGGRSHQGGGGGSKGGMTQADASRIQSAGDRNPSGPTGSSGFGGRAQAAAALNENK
jgi:hypothetical protein